MATSWLIQIPGTVLLVYVYRASIGAVWALITFYIAVDAALMVWPAAVGRLEKDQPDRAAARFSGRGAARAPRRRIGLTGTGEGTDDLQGTADAGAAGVVSA